MVEMRHRLPKGAPLVARHEFILSYCTGKRVLHLGCTDAGLTDAWIRSGRLLHSEPSEVASDLYGVDIDESDLERMRALGLENLFRWDVYNLNSLSLPGAVDIVLAGEILEHLDNPGQFLTVTRQFIRDNGGGELLLTVPNALSVRNVPFPTTITTSP